MGDGRCQSRACQDEQDRAPAAESQHADDCEERP